MTKMIIRTPHLIFQNAGNTMQKHEKYDDIKIILIKTDINDIC